MIFHFSPKSQLLSLSSSSLTSLCLRPFLPSASKFPFYPSLLLKPRFSFARHVSTGDSLRMDSPSPDPPPLSVADGLKNQCLREQDNDNIKSENKNKNFKLSLEDLSWDYSFVRELPGDPRSDSIPRQVLISTFLKFFFMF